MSLTGKRALITGAQVRGVTSVTMDVMHGNDRALAMIKGHWPAARTRRSKDCDTLCIQLPDDEQQQPAVFSTRLASRPSGSMATAGRV